jgi:hypothetical protein
MMGGGIWSRSYWRYLFSFALERPLSVEECDEILSKVNGFGPRPYEETWESVLRSTDPCIFWRSQI